ncbi:hypothetical protein B0H13DRAFT_2659506 [Mycena leptocephala]|nr:hypothetical protein B0H13DRAFT_2659506 [Mycena leptocephala]
MHDSCSSYCRSGLPSSPSSPLRVAFRARGMLDRPLRRACGEGGHPCPPQRCEAEQHTDAGRGSVRGYGGAHTHPSSPAHADGRQRGANEEHIELCCACVSSAISWSTRSSAGIKAPMDDPSWTRTTIFDAVSSIETQVFFPSGSMVSDAYRAATKGERAERFGGLYSPHTTGLERYCGFCTLYAVPSKSFSDFRIL